MAPTMIKIYIKYLSPPKKIKKTLSKLIIRLNIKVRLIINFIFNILYLNIKKQKITKIKVKFNRTKKSKKRI